ncbi:MAG: GTPase HflX [Deltaproteobacteria bacterium]|nr:GTPase HflX [Deltaproteobacteria bacterium]
MKINSDPVEEHREVPLGDDGRWEEIVAHWRDRSDRASEPRQETACYVVSVGQWRESYEREAQLSEILALTHALGNVVVGCETRELRRLDPRTLIGRGTCEAIGARATAKGARVLVVDAELSASQARNIEEATGLSVRDREGVILNVFLRHARTPKARIQVEIAQLEYLRPRIRGVGLVMDQQTGGAVNSRGPGETASELLARQLDARLEALRHAFGKELRAAETQRNSRSNCRRIALVGYTNAGKTTLMNGLTGAALSARDMPFETLDTTSRSLTRHGGDVLLSDTVGFIRRLPARLLASFESTFAEAREASLLAVVVDVSDVEWRMHLATTHELLSRLKADAIPRFYVFNKADRLGTPAAEDTLNEAAQGHEHATLCGHDAEAVTRLRDALIRAVRGGRHVRLLVPYAATRAMSLVYSKCRVIAAEPEATGVRFDLDADAMVLTQLEKALAEAEQ